GNCLRGGNTATAIREADGPGGSGINVALGDGGAEGIFALHEADGRIASIVTGEGTSISNSRLRRYDADLANGVDLLNLTNPDIRTSVAHEVWGRCLYLVATTNKTGVPSLVRFAADGSAHKLHPLNNHWSNTLATDADNVYFADNNDVLRLRHGQNLASAAVTVTTLPNSDSVIDMGIAGDGSLYLSGFNLGSGVKHTGTYTVASAASAAVPLQILPATSGVIASDGDLLYADDYDSSTGTRTAITVKTDGTVVSSLPNASYSPLTPGAFNADGAGLDPLLRHYIQPAKLLLLEARSPDTAVSVVDLATGHVLKAGALPTTGGSLGSARGFGRRVMLAWYSNASGASSNYDLFALDTSTSNSIAAFQNTAGDERTFP
ncbi:MAG TPA: hypothetical protein VHE37_05145, partial [Nevskiaceae bacterium]|nr:hypothetical protein [Nevskiaceae bacterium]